MAATEVSDPAESGHSPQAVRDAQIASLTGMRGFAALVVVVVHTTVRTQDYHWLGLHGYGPIALFTLSGFLLYRPFARWALGVSERPSLKSFAIRRVLRIFPAWWVVLHIWYFAYPKAVPDSFVDWLKDITLISTMRLMTLPQGLQQAWSMGTELTWYFALPVLAFVAHLVIARLPVNVRVKAHVMLLLGVLPVAVGFQYWAYADSEYISATFWLPHHLWVFSFGALVGLMMEAERAGLSNLTRGRKILADPWILPIVALLFMVLSTSEWAGPTDMSRPSTVAEGLVRDLAGAGLAGTLLLISVFGGPRSPIVRLLSTRFMQATGRWSYGIYLWHLPLILLLWEDVTFSNDFAGLLKWFLLVLPISYLLGAASYAWVEQPAMNLSRKLAPNKPKPRAGARRAAPGGSPVQSPVQSHGQGSAALPSVPGTRASADVHDPLGGAGRHRPE